MERTTSTNTTTNPIIREKYTATHSAATWHLCRSLSADHARVALTCALSPGGFGGAAVWTSQKAGAPDVLAQGLYFVGEREHVVRLHTGLFAEVVVPRPPDGLVEVSVGGRVEYLR